MSVLKNLRIEKIVFGGEGLSHFNGKVVFVRFTAPDDLVDAAILKETKSYIKARLECVVKPSPSRQASKCRFFMNCGGCDFLHIPYIEQLRIKNRIMLEIFHNMPEKIQDITASPTVFFYRNKVQLPYRNGELGFYQKGSHTIVNIDNCLITRQGINAVFKTIKVLLKKYGLSSYDEKQGSGYIRNIILRESGSARKIVVIFVVNSMKIKGKLRNLANELAHNNSVHSIFFNGNTSRGNNILGRSFKLMNGKSFLPETITDYKFLLYPGSFVQINIDQAENLYKKAIELLAPNDEDCVFDAFCGPGVISILLSSRVKTILGADLAADAIKSAKLSAKLNNCTNLKFVCKDINNIKRETLLTLTKAVLNPPRGGLSKELSIKLNDIDLIRIVYISCNPQTLKRDIDRLTNYKVERIFPFDMFSQTYHIENVALLLKR